MSDSPADPTEENLVDRLVQMIRSGRVGDAMSAVDAHEYPAAVGAALGSAVKIIYRQHHDVTNMIVAGNMGLAYCLRHAGLATDEEKARALKTIGRGIAFNTAVNCWPGWGDAGIIIEEAHIAAGLAVAKQSRALVQELVLGPREQGTAHWLVGALELAAGRLDDGRVAFEQAEQAYRAAGATSSHALLARGYMALARKADPQSRQEGAVMLGEIVARLRAEGSKEAIFFADQLATADRILLET